MIRAPTASTSSPSPRRSTACSTGCRKPSTPGAARLAEVSGEVGFGGDLAMFGDLSAGVPCQRLPHLLGYGGQAGGQVRGDLLSFDAVGQGGQDRVPAGALDRGGDGGGAGSHDQVAFLTVLVRSGLLVES